MKFRTIGAASALFLTSLCSLSNSTAAQSAGVQTPATRKGFDPQPDPPGIGTMMPGGLLASMSDIAFPAGNGGFAVARRHAEWGDPNRLSLDVSAATAIGGGTCLFDATYYVSNLTQAPTPQFANAIVIDRLEGNTWVSAGVAATQVGLTLGAAQVLAVHAKIALQPGTFAIRVMGDIGHAVNELDEYNNRGVVYVSVTGDCGAPAVQQPMSPSRSVDASTSSGTPMVPSVSTTNQKAIVRFLPPGTINTADQTDDRPAPTSAGYGVPDTKTMRASAQMGGGSVRPVAQSIIINDFRQSLNANLGSAASQIVVRIEGGDVSLIGKVPTADARALAERLARTIPGVTSVKNQLVVSAVTGGQP